MPSKHKSSVKSSKSVVPTIRLEDRHSCHNISFILGLMIAGHVRTEIILQVYQTMMVMVTPLDDQASN